jgi:hypothetical protein
LFREFVEVETGKGSAKLDRLNRDLHFIWAQWRTRLHVVPRSWALMLIRSSCTFRRIGGERARANLDAEPVRPC